MSIFCMNCGKELPDDANFCLKCGTPVGNAAKPTPQPVPRWEYCDIVSEYAGFDWRQFSNTVRLYAKAIGPKGIYRAAESERLADNYPRDYEKKHVAVCDSLVQQLVTDGWELVGRGDEWFAHKFRRRVN